MKINNNEEKFDSSWDVQSVAIWYLTKLNWRIFPTGRNKIPLIGWSKYRTVKPSVEEVKQWFTKFPTANIGLITGESTGVVVIDIDPRHNGTDEDFKDIKTVKSKTGGGGFHLFFKYEAGLVNKAGIKEGIDVRAEGGYVVLPPSIHESGNKYEWINSPDTTPLAPLPDFVKDWFKKSKTNSNSNWNPDILDGTKEGSRNESAASVAGKLLIRFPEGEWETEAYTHFKNWNSQNNPPLSDNELRAVFESIIEREKVSREAKDKPQASGTETPQGIDQVQNNDGIPIINGTFISTLPKLITELTADQARVDWIWEGYLARGHLTFFSALWKVGKSTLIACLLKALQESKEFAGQSITPTKTLILSEESETLWAGRREDLGLAGDIYIHCKPTNAKLTYKQWESLIEYYAKFCEEKGINLFIIDTVSTFWPVRDEGNNPEIDAALLVLNRLLEKNICTLVVHHFRKSGGTEGTATRGGGGIGSRADILAEFTRLEAENPNSTQRVLRTYSRFEESPPELVVELVGTEYLARGTRSEVSKEARLQAVLGILQEQSNLTITEILDNWDSESKKPVSRTIRNYIEALLQDGRINQSGKKPSGKTEAPSYSLNNGGNEGGTTSRDSIVINKLEADLHSIDQANFAKANPTLPKASSLSVEEIEQIFANEPEEKSQTKGGEKPNEN